MLKIGDKFKIKKKSSDHHCYVGQEVIVMDIDCGLDPTFYLVESASDPNYFCCWQTVGIEPEEECKSKSDYYTKCFDCGKFVKKDLWIKKGTNKHALCDECLSCYEDENWF